MLDLGGGVLAYARGPAPAGVREPLRLGAVVRTRLVRGAPWEPVVATRAEGAQMLVADAVGVARDPARVLRTVGAAMGAAVALTGRHGDPDAAAGALLAHLASADPAAAPAWAGAARRALSSAAPARPGATPLARGA